MEITQIRNATIIVEYNNIKFLIDPWLGPKDYMLGFDTAINSEIRQPRVELPMSINEIVDVDVVILTHIHPDHWDIYAEEAIDKDKLIFVQAEFDKNYLVSKGFKNVEILSSDGFDYKNVMLYKTPCQHGRREIIKPICDKIGMPYDAMGVIFKNSNEKTLYVAGDTIYCDEVKDTMDKFLPDIVVLNLCGASVINGEKLIMNKQDLKEFIQDYPDSTVIASHMDTVSHLTVTRNDLKEFIKINNIQKILVPKDGEKIKL